MTEEKKELLKANIDQAIAILAGLELKEQLQWLAYWLEWIEWGLGIDTLEEVRNMIKDRHNKQGW